MIQLLKFINWLSIVPTTSEISRALVTEYLCDQKVSRIRICGINNDDSTTLLGQYGFPENDAWRGQVTPSELWKLWISPRVEILNEKNRTIWSSNSELCISIMRERGIISGILEIEFSQPVADGEKEAVLNRIGVFASPIALFLALNHQHPIFAGLTKGPSGSPDEANANQLTQRQIVILCGMVEGKSNLELATEMGFSVSTIRQEAMRIYRALSVGDRKEAAKKALLLTLI